MKKKFTRILGVGLAIAMLISLMTVAAPASAATLKWTSFSPYPSTTSSVLAAVNITDIAVYGYGEVIYVGSVREDGGGTNNGLIYKSTTAGRSWSALGVSGNASLVAVAPDDPDVVAFADNATLTVWVSTDGGSTFGSLGVPQESGATVCDNISDIAISALSGGIHYVAVAGAEQGEIANVWYWNIGAASPYWHEINDLPTIDADTAGNSTALALEFSPNFPSDQTMAVLTFEAGALVAGTDYVRVELYSFNQSKWNDDAGFSSYGVAVVSDDGITGVLSGDIALSPDYLGSDDSMRLTFVGVTLDGNTDAEKYNGLYRTSDTTVKALKDGAAVKLHSVAYDGSTLVAGRLDSNIVYYSSDPTASTPTVGAARSLKRPGIDVTGQNERTVVAWAGAELVAGTSHNASAFSVSVNDGASFSDVSLLSPALTNVTGIEVSPDGETVYLATNDGTTVSLWRYASAWERVLAFTAYGDSYLLRLAPDDPDVVYMAQRGGTDVYYSADGGTGRWFKRTARYAIQDLAVETTGDYAYVIQAGNGKISKSTNGGFTWGKEASSQLTGGYMIASLGEDAVIAGGDDGYVAYSSDGGSSWTKIAKQVYASTAANVSVAATGAADGDYVYAGMMTTGKDITRWQIGTDTGWTSIKEGTDNVTGLALQDGVLYAFSWAGFGVTNGSTLYRTLGPTASPTVYWSTVNSTDNEFFIVPKSFKVSGGSNTLWAIDRHVAAADVLYSYADPLTVDGPDLIGPAQGFEARVNPISGFTQDVTFSWTKPCDRVTTYELKLAFDSAFQEVAKTIKVGATGGTVGQVVGRSASAVFDVMPGETYFWKVRVKQPVFSPWSVARSFSAEEAESPATSITVEPPAAPEVTVEAPAAPEITVNVPESPTPVAVPPTIPTYLLWTIIGIGAVLIIALIVLIVRTRRVV